LNICRLSCAGQIVNLVEQMAAGYGRDRTSRGETMKYS